MSFLFKDSGNKPVDPLVARKRAAIFSLPFAMAGFMALILLLHDGLLGGLDRQKLLRLGSVIVASGGFIALIFGIAGKKSSLAADLKLSGELAGKPWLRRPDWASGKIKSAGFPHAKSYLTMGIAFCVIGAIIAVLVVPKALHDKNYSALVAGVFPVVGIAFLASVVKKFRAHSRFGGCVFEMAHTPAPLGGVLAGAIRTSVPLEFAGELRVLLFCVRKTTTGAGQNRRTEEKALWRDELVFKSKPELIAASPGGAVPVRFDLPPGQPGCSQRGNEEICWRLEMKIPAAKFHTTFELPVFKIAREEAGPETA